jgi:hypothetical protein
MREQFEFFPVDDLPWTPDPQAPGVDERVPSRVDDGVGLTRITRWRPGLDTSAADVTTHDFHEEVHILDGELTDLTLGRTFGPGQYALRRPGVPHGPYRTGPGCVMFEVRTA